MMVVKRPILEKLMAEGGDKEVEVLDTTDHTLY
jgi:hypothetical protein